MKINKICVMGLGYIGLPTAAMFASKKVDVLGVDINKNTVDTVNRGEIHIVEHELDVAVRDAVAEGYLSASTVPEKADVFIIAVPTPFIGDDHEPDLKYIHAASIAIAPFLESGNIVILESTSPVGATEQLAKWLSTERSDLTFPQSHGEQSDVMIAHCPERVLPGKIMAELISNDRVIGGMTLKCSNAAADVYRLFAEGECTIASSPRAAEMAKLTENSFRDVNIAFANELSIICDKHEIDVMELIALANRHPRVDILKPGPGVGGHCIAVDPWFIVSAARQESRLIETARQVNDSKPLWVLEKINSEIKDYLREHPQIKIKDVCIAVYGVAFKPDVDDLRESPALIIAEELNQSCAAKILIVEPNIDTLPSSISSLGLTQYDKALKAANIHIYLVGHKEFSTRHRDHDRVLDFAGVTQNAT